MRSRQFFALNAQISGIMKEEEARELSITHSSKPGDRIKEVISELNAQRRIRTVSESTAGILQRGEATGVAAAEIEAMRERQRAAAQEIAKDRDAWLEKLKSQIAANQAGTAPQPSSPDE